MEDKKNTKITVGILAHVDAGKTTLTEQLLYHGGVLRSPGRVDHGDAFLDTEAMEKERGITIFSKEARLHLGGKDLILLDTPGHADFSAQAERCLSVMDYGILLISAPEGVTPHTKALWNLLRKRAIPTAVFVNKTDLLTDGAREEQEVLEKLKEELSSEIVNFTVPDREDSQAFAEEIAMCEESLLDAFLQTGALPKDCIPDLVASCRLFPCFFGSALKEAGIEAFIKDFTALLRERTWPDTFGARIFRISRDSAGKRQVHLRITGGSLSVRDTLSVKKRAGDEAGDGEEKGAGEGLLQEKITGLRLISGSKSEAVGQAFAGEIITVTGLTGGCAGEGLGYEREDDTFTMLPLLSYRVSATDGTAPSQLLEKLRILEEENPELCVRFEEEKSEIFISLMGEIQTQVMESLMESRFGIRIALDEGEVLYRETIAEPVEGVGHFEPLRHYAEVHLVLEPLPRGSGLVFGAKLPPDTLAENWKRLILQHLSEKTHKGVLTGSPVTDMKITLRAGRAHPKHTEGGDFRQATYRAVRQGLMQAHSLLLEPWYNLTITLPSSYVGKILTDLEKRAGSGSVMETSGETSLLRGRAPVSTIRNYAADLAAATGGRGRIEFSFAGFDLCHNTEEVLLQKAYDPERDIRNRADSVFCAHGASQIVPWDEVFSKMHLPSVLAEKKESFSMDPGRPVSSGTAGKLAGEEELRRIFEQTYKTSWDKRRQPESGETYLKSFEKAETSGGQDEERYRKKKKVPGDAEEILFVDGYNVLHADPELSALAKDSLDAARNRLLDLLEDYQGSIGGRVVAVFDAYKTAGGCEHKESRGALEVVFTKERQTADMYIEKEVHTMAGKARITVATSDGIEQVISRGQGAYLISARELLRCMQQEKKAVRDGYLAPKAEGINPVLLTDAKG